MQDWTAGLESMVDNKLKKWDKHRKWENREAIHYLWQWEHTLIKIDVFWRDQKETIRLKYTSPREDHDFMWHGLDLLTFNKIQDRVGNLAMTTMHPIIDPELDA